MTEPSEMILYIPRDDGGELQITIPIAGNGEHWVEIYHHFRDKGIKLALFTEHTTRVEMKSWE